MTENRFTAIKAEDFNNAMAVAIELYLLKIELGKRTIDLRLASDATRCREQKMVRKQLGYALLEGDYSNAHKIFQRYEQAGVESLIFFQALIEASADFESMGKKLSASTDIATRNLELVVEDEEFVIRVLFSRPGVTVHFEALGPAKVNWRELTQAGCSPNFDESVEIKMAS